MAALVGALILAGRPAFAQGTAPLAPETTALVPLQEGTAAPCSPDIHPCTPPDASTRLVLGPTGRTLRQGQGYLRYFNILFPMVEFGITDRISVGGGTPLVPGPMFHSYWITPKVQVHRGERTQAAVGVVHVGNLAEDLHGFGVAYGVATMGSTRRAVSLGAGCAYASSHDGRGAAPVVLVGAERRMSRHTMFITENYVGPHIAYISVGERISGRRITSDAALAVVITSSGSFALPMLNFAWHFGRR